MKQNILNKRRFHISSKEIEVYPGAGPNCPVIYLNTFRKEGDSVYRALSGQAADFTLVAVSGLEWDHDMVPWDIPPVSKNNMPCTGGADAYLELLTGEIMPEAERLVEGGVLWRGLAGYSLAGLFALYTLYQTTLFSRIASVSGSLWFPGFQDYALSREMKILPERLYLSLGDRESRTQNPYLKTVQERTEAIHAYYRRKGIETIYKLNPGNHFQNEIRRTAAGIAWILASAECRWQAGYNKNAGGGESGADAPQPVEHRKGGGNEMFIREYQSSDCKELTELFYNTVHTVNAKDYAKEQLDVWATEQIDLKKWNQTLQEHFSIVAIDDGLIVGFGDIDRTGYLDRLYVHSGYQGKGIATAICNRLESAVQENIVTHASITAKPFFEKRGYKVVKEQQVERQGIFLTNFVMIKER